MSFSSAGEEIVQAAKVGLYKAAVEIMYESQKQVPVDTATLKGSAQIKEPERVGDRISITMGYGYGVQVNPKTGQIAAQYAVPVHERLDQYHAPPTKAKFLEDPVLAYIGRLGETVGASIRRISVRRFGVAGHPLLPTETLKTLPGQYEALNFIP